MGVLSFLGGGSGSNPPESSNAYIANGEDGKPYVKDPDALWQEVSELRDDALTARKEHEKLWAICWMFYKGDQWRKPGETSIVKVNVGRRPKITINRILPMVQTRRAHVLKNRPIGVVMPKTTDEEDRNAARIAQDVLAYDQEHLKNWEILDGKLSLCMFVTGNAFKKIYWDPTKGGRRETNAYTNSPETGAPLQTPAAPAPEGVSQNPETGGTTEEAVRQETADQKELPPPPTPEAMGDVCIEFIPPEEVLPEPAATTLEDCQRLLHRTLKPLKWVKDSYGDAAAEVESIDLKTERGKSLARGANLFGMTEDEVAERVEVIEAWFRPTEEYPQGLHAVWADDQLMTAGPTPPAYDYIPFVHYVEIETDEFWGTSSVAQVLDPQKALNLAISRDEFMRQRLRPKLMAATDSGLDEHAYTSDESEIVFVHHPFYPQFTKPPDFKRDAEAVAYFAQAIDDVGGAFDIMRGQIKGGDIRSGRMVNYLQEYAGTVLAGPARAIERGEEKTGNMLLRLRKHYTSEPRLYYIVGRNRAVEVQQFIGSDIEGCADYVVQTGSALPMSLSEKRDLVLSLVEKGILLAGDPRILKLIGMPSDMEEIFEEEQLDRDNATEENHVFLAMSEQIVSEAYLTLQQAKQMQLEAMSGMMQSVASTPTGPAPMGMGMGAPAEPQAPPAPQAPAPPMDAGAPPAPGGEPMTPVMLPDLMDTRPSPVEVMEFLKLQPRDFENHEVHLEAHNRSRKSKAYKMMPPAAQAIFDTHCDAHAFYLLPPPMATPEGGQDGGGRPQGQGQGNERKKQDGSPEALSGGKPPGGGGAGDNAQANQERSAGLPPTPKPPGANNHHLR